MNIFHIINTVCFVLEIRLEFLGKAYVHWSESHGSGKNRRTVHYTAHELYFNNVVSVFGKGIANFPQFGYFFFFFFFLSTVQL